MTTSPEPPPSAQARAHRLRQRLSGTPFDHSWTRALALHAQALADPFAPDPSRRQPPEKARG